MQTGYLKVARIQNTKAGFEAIVYELAGKAYLGLVLGSTSLYSLLNLIDDDSAMEILAAIAGLIG